MSSGQPGVPTCYQHAGKETWIRCQRCERPICPDCMRPASVGFQCPSCVKEGAATTRSAQAPYGGQRVANPQLTTLVLIGINVVVWLAVVATGGSQGALFQKLALLPKSTLFRFPDGSLQLIQGVSGGAGWQLLTSMFTHAQPLHIGFNMVALWFLGPQLEQVLGRARFLALYLLSGLTGSVAVMWWSGVHTQTMGASGAIFGLLGGLLVVALKVGADTRQILMWIGINAVFTISLRSTVSWQGHLGGLVGGALIAALISYAPRERRRSVQWGGLAAVLVVSVVLVVVRAAAL
ncbi:MAG: rhomboid family intramembrane serine protease [Actinomycetota bacterium]|nr:rhomboid family intramembrane serine protease [Actinomycetota bacterium]